jgi:hypothetical protein
MRPLMIAITALALGLHAAGSIGDALRKKANFYSGGLTVGEAVAKGEADYTSPATAVVLSASQDAAASRRVIEFLRFPVAQ